MHDNEFIDVGFVSDMQKLQNAILIEFLEESLKLNCKMISIDKAMACKLVILDCDVLQCWQLEAILYKAHKIQIPIKLVLINVKKRSPHEAMVRWSGVEGIFYKNTDEDSLLFGLKRILRDDVWLPRDFLVDFVRRNRPKYSLSKVKNELQLSRRHREIIKLFESNPTITNAEIADRLYLSEHTINYHMRTLFKLINVHTRGELAVWAEEFSANR